MTSETSFQVFFLKEHRKNSLKNIVFPWESVFTAIAKIPQGLRTAQTAYCAMVHLSTKDKVHLSVPWCNLLPCPILHLGAPVVCHDTYLPPPQCLFVCLYHGAISFNAFHGAGPSHHCTTCLFHGAIFTCCPSAAFRRRPVFHLLGRPDLENRGALEAVGKILRLTENSLGM